MLTINDLKEQGLLLFETISGSHAYGLSIPTSDVDLKGVFILPKAQFYGLDYVPQVNDTKNDEVYYELRRFMELLSKNNPNLLELLHSPDDCIRYKDPLFDLIKPSLFLSKKCKNTFANYAWSQIKKARGLNKKIANPMAKERKGILDFCYINYQQGSIPVTTWLAQEGKQQASCGLVAIPHMHDVYGLYYNPKAESYKGLVRNNTVDTVLLSSVPEGAQQVALFYYNKDGYKKYCKDYKLYWNWVEERNESRYATTIAHGKNYDSKNIMHTFRLLDMAYEILSEGKLQVRRPNRTFLLDIRQGRYDYDTLLQQAEEKITAIEQAYTTSLLPEAPDKAAIERILVEIRSAFYARG
ncbi:MAG: nucleotidyltransferase domain-containing protein [Aureispira sp.]